MNKDLFNINLIKFLDEIKKEKLMKKNKMKRFRMRNPLHYRYVDIPNYLADENVWSQTMKFKINLKSSSKKMLLENRSALVCDVVKLFKKYGISVEDFNQQNVRI